MSPRRPWLLTLPLLTALLTAAPPAFALYKVVGVKPAADNDPRAASLSQQYARMVAAEEYAAWIATLRQRFPVTINTAAIEQKPQ